MERNCSIEKAVLARNLVALKAIASVIKWVSNAQKLANALDALIAIKKKSINTRKATFISLDLAKNNIIKHK